MRFSKPYVATSPDLIKKVGNYQKLLFPKRPSLHCTLFNNLKYKDIILKPFIFFVEFIINTTLSETGETGQGPEGGREGKVEAEGVDWKI